MRKLLNMGIMFLFSFFMVHGILHAVAAETEEGMETYEEDWFDDFGSWDDEDWASEETAESY